jgi:glycosyltransferase involved in cell wall biosynthesis
VLAVLPMYDPLATSGELEYVRRVIEGLAARGMAVQVLTTYDTAVRRETEEAFAWPNAWTRIQPPPAPVAVRRFRALNVPGFVRGYATGLVQRARDHRMRSRSLGLGYSYLDTGFHELEHWKSGFAFRWTGPVAHFQVDRPGGRDVVVELYAPGITNLDVIANGRPAATIGLKRESWQKVELPLPASGVAVYELRVRPTFKPRGDRRELGVAIRTVTVRTRQGEDLPLPLDRNRDSLVLPLDSFRIAEQYDADGQEWGRDAPRWDAALKGPVSLGLARAAVRAARESDVVLVAGTPYLTSVYGSRAARRAGKPVVALPFLRLRDPGQYRPWLHDVVRRYAHVVCQGPVAARYVEHRWKVPASVLPGGVDARELDDPGIDGRRFRERHRLGDGPLVLMLAPKSRTSAYEAFCAAAREVGGQFVLAGPDEDGLPMPGPAVRHLPAIRAEETLDAIDACDVFVLPSPEETSIVPFLRAWMRRKPVVGHADAEAFREVVRHDEDGLLVRGHEALVDALRRLLGDPGLRARLGAAGRRKVEAGMTWDHIGASVEGLLYELVSREGAPAAKRPT